MTHPKISAKDFDRVLMLLNIVEKVSTVAPGYMNITSEAMAELREINEGLRQQKEAAQGRVPQPAQYGDPNSPVHQPNEPDSKALASEPIASKPVLGPKPTEPPVPQSPPDAAPVESPAMERKF